jgi:hypothetical protein
LSYRKAHDILTTLHQQLLLTVLFGISMMWSNSSAAQELEPRRWSHLPIGANFAGLGYAYTDADISLNPTLQLENVRGESHAAVFAYTRVLDVFGKSGRVDLLLPYSVGRWDGLLEGEPASTRRSGFADPRVRIAVNLLGSPAQRGTEFYRPDVNTILGVAMEVHVPLGEYQEDRLINLGRNQWVFRPQIGIVHDRNKWAAELTASAWLYSENDDFDSDKNQDNNPLFSLQGHLIHTFRPGLWASVSAGYGGGARSIIDGAPASDRIRKFLWAISVGLPVNRRQGVKIAYMRGKTLEDTGSDFGRIILAYSVMWGGD